MQTIQYRKSRIWDMKENRYKKMLTQNQDCATFYMRDIRENHVGVLLRGTYMAAGNQQKHLSLNFPHKLKAILF